MESVPNFEYTESSLIKEPVPWSDLGTHLSLFDEKLRSAWDKAVVEGMILLYTNRIKILYFHTLFNSGVFRYTLEDCVYKKLDLGNDCSLNLPCIAILNPQRATNRRKREDFESMNEEFNEEKFNFKKIKKNEILLTLTNNSECLRDHCQNIIVNISPIEYGHVLLAPFLHDGLPQRCTMESLLLAFNTVELSSQPSKLS